MLQTAIIILAAGCSSRLGRPKQLLSHLGTTLLRHAASTALGANLGPVIVVLGAAEEACRAALVRLPVTLIMNASWEDGMGSSIAAGMACVDDTLYRCVLLMLCDQPAITPKVLQSLDVRQHDTGASIVASRFNGTLGPPVLFAASHFPQLRKLSGHQGAKSLFQDQPGLAVIDCPEAAWDIDTEKEAAKLQQA